MKTKTKHVASLSVDLHQYCSLGSAVALVGRSTVMVKITMVLNDDENHGKHLLQNFALIIKLISD